MTIMIMSMIIITSCNDHDDHNYYYNDYHNDEYEYDTYEYEYNDDGNDDDENDSSAEKSRDRVLKKLIYHYHRYYTS
jgi:hypothetical protein